MAGCQLGIGMHRGISAGVKAASAAVAAGAGAGTTLVSAGDGWADRAGALVSYKVTLYTAPAAVNAAGTGIDIVNSTQGTALTISDNGGTLGTRIYNAGMRGAKVTPYQGGTRVPSFWRWPAGFRGGVDCPALTAHIDVFPTLAKIIDAVVAHGTPEDIARRLGEYLTAGANHVAILVYGGPEKVLPTLSELAGPLGLSR